MIVVLDSNIWIGELGLHSATGSALRFFIKKNGVRVALPEVVRLEVHRNIRDSLLKESAEIRRRHRSLLAYFRKLPEIVLPTEAEIVAKADELFDTFGIDIEHIPFSLASARSSLLKTTDGHPPSAPQNQQFKDGVIWADCMNLLTQDSVTLVTQDKGFYHARDFSKGLAESLELEAKAATNTFKIMNSIKDLLATIRDEKIHIDGEVLASAVSAASDITSFIGDKGFAVGNILSTKNKLFATENPNMLLVQYEIERNCLNIGDQGRLHSKVVLTGTGSYNYSTNIVEQVVPGNATLSFVDTDGAAREFRMIYGSANIYIGHRTVEYQERSFALTS